MDAFEGFAAPTRLRPTPPSDTAFPTVYPDPPIWEHAHASGHRTLWVVFVLMVIVLIGFVALSWTVPAAKRLYHSITTLIIVIATLSYFAMATGQGVTWHHTLVREKHKGDIPDTFHHVNRQVYYARYIDWLLTTPLLLLDLSLLAGLNGATIFTAVTADVVMVLGGLFASFGHTKLQKWGWYTIACIAYVWILYTLLITGRRAASTRGANVSKFFTSIAAYTLILWTAYPIIWGIADGSHRVSVDTEIIAYGVLDVLAKGVFGAWLLFTHKRLPETHANVGGFWTHGLNSEGRIRVGDDDEVA